MNKNLFSEKITPYMQEIAIGNNQYADIYKLAYQYSDDENVENALDSVNAIGEGLTEISPSPIVTNIYGNRALLKITNKCFAHCRYCFRRDDIDDDLHSAPDDEIKKGINYIKQHTEITEVILSGGDPFVLKDKKILWILSDLMKLKHIRRVRIDTNIFATSPGRINTKLITGILELKKKYNKQLIIIGHFIHYQELSKTLIDSVNRLINIGVIIRGHTPLLKGINDDFKILQKTFAGLVDIGVHPYYLIHYISHQRTRHFELPLSEGLDIYDDVMQHCTGIEIPNYIVYLGNGRGKKRVIPNNIKILKNGKYELLDKDGKKYIYQDFID